MAYDGIQRIVNYCETMTINRRRLTGVQYTRSEIAKISETPSRNPWRFDLTISAGLQYGANRDLLEQIDYLDRRYPETISFSTTYGASPGLSYMFAYQGQLSTAQRNAITISVFSNTNQMNITNLPSIQQLAGVGGANAVIFAKGDIIQPAGFPFPFTVTQNAVRGSDTSTTATIVLNLHRPNFNTTSSFTGANLVSGNDVQFRVFCPNMPTYKLSPGGVNALISWTSDFQLYEYTGEVQ